MIYDTRRYTQSIKLSIRKDGGQRYKTNTIFVCVWKYYAVLQVVTSMVLEPFSLVAWTCWFMGLQLCPDTSWLWWEMVIVCLSWNCHFSCCVSFMPFLFTGRSRKKLNISLLAFDVILAFTFAIGNFITYSIYKMMSTFENFSANSGMGTIRDLRVWVHNSIPWQWHQDSKLCRDTTCYCILYSLG